MYLCIGICIGYILHPWIKKLTKLLLDKLEVLKTFLK